MKSAHPLAEHVQISAMKKSLSATMKLEDKECHLAGKALPVPMKYQVVVLPLCLIDSKRAQLVEMGGLDLKEVRLVDLNLTAPLCQRVNSHRHPLPRTPLILVGLDPLPQS